MSRVLLIEDDRDSLELMAYLLRAAGHTPLSIGSGEGALGVLDFHIPDLIICDLRLPRMTGFDVAREVKKSPALREVRLVAASAMTDSSVRQRVREVGFDDFIPKPFTPETFMARVEVLLGPAQRPQAAAMDPTSDVGEAPGKPVPAGSRQTVLAVDDRPANLDLTRAILEPFGYRVETAGGVAEGLARAREVSPDLILLDVHMGDGTGFDLLRLLREDPPLQEIPWIVISATYLEMDHRGKAVGLDDTNFMLRPTEPQALLAKVEARLAGRATKSRTSHPVAG